MADGVFPEPGDFEPGTQIASYQLAEQVGWGAMAAVYRALEVRLDRWVALKILSPEVAGDASFRQRFASESRAAASVDHPNIIPVFDAGEAGGVLYIAMRFVDGGDIRTVLHQLGRLDAAQVAAVVAQVASALDAAHAIGLVHRDVKPANILLAVSEGSRPEHVYLSDFGLSRQAMAASGPGLAGQIVGTLDYMAPEQIEGRPADGRADQYALACTAYEMLAGEPPFRRGEDLSLLRVRFAESPLPLTSLRPDLPPDIDAVLARAMARAPADRYDTCLDFVAALVEACGLEWGAVGPLLPSSPQPAILAAPLADAGPDAASAATVYGDGLPEPQPAGQGVASHGGAGQDWSPAPPLIAAQSMTVARVPDRAEQATLTAALTGRDPGSGGPGRPEPYFTDPGPAGWRLPVIVAAIVVVLLAMVGGTYLVLRGGGMARSGQAAQNPQATQPHPSAAAGTPGAGAAGAPSPGGSPSPGSSNNPASSPSAGSTPSASPSHARPRRVRRRGPAATVSAYVAAINKHHYHRAWHLRGRDGVNSYAAFVQGFSTTRRDVLFILSVTGNAVKVRLDALQTNGTVKTYEGTYTVEHGVIATANVRQIG
ncbi:MAG: serine/threonine-protein kinase [Actinomycetota bacterium]